VRGKKENKINTPNGFFEQSGVRVGTSKKQSLPHTEKIKLTSNHPQLPFSKNTEPHSATGGKTIGFLFGKEKLTENNQ
jgi:hypothetical protein